MTDKEKQILEELDTKTRDIEVPKELEPEEMKKRLKTPKKKIWKRGYTYVAAAACLVIVIGTAYVWQNHNLTGGRADSSISDSQEYKPGKAESAKDYKEIYQYFKNAQEARTEGVKEKESSSAAGGPAVVYSEDSKADTGSDQLNGSASPRSESAASHSDTNVRTEGVGEADSVKTDGTHLFALKESAMEIAIVDTTQEKMEEISSIKPENGVQIAEFYVDGDKMFVLGNVENTKADEDTATLYYEEDMVLLTYDLSDIASPKLISSLSQSGRYTTSRYVDGYLYLFSNFYNWGNCKEDDISTYVPSVNGKAVPIEDIILPQEKMADQYTVITAVKADAPGEIADQKAVLSRQGQCYVSTQNIYIYECIWRDTGSRFLTKDTTTNVRRISYKDGVLKGEAQGKVNGYVHDSFCIDENNGYLRLVTTSDNLEEPSNAVYVLDQTLKTVGKITDLAKGEVIYSARLLGDTGYFVTYKQTDPLFSVDFSEPEKPEIIGSLKIPGFSEYLHLYDEGLLLGIGMDTDEESGVTNGVKLSMFDISDPSDVKEVHKYTISGAYSSDVFNDYRAVLINKEKNMIGFSTYGNSEMYYIFSYDKTNGFNQEMEEEVNGMSYMGTRGIYIEDKLYVVKGNAIESYHIGDYKKIDDILL